jgi:YebC/PmpR family DNA-binding regulatory protein
MSGHNKWSKVKRKKEVTDKKKSKLFSILARTIALEAKTTGGNKESPGLRRAIEKARSENMPNDNIERAIARGTGAEGKSLEHIVCEAYGPGGVAIIILAITDNRNRTVSLIKHTLSLFDISLSAPGGALWAFVHEKDSWQPKTRVTLSESDDEKLMEIIEALDSLDDVNDVFTNGPEE